MSDASGDHMVDLWTDPTGVSALLAGGPQAGDRTSPFARVMGMGIQQQPYWWKKYQSMGIVMTLFVVRIISFCFLHVVDVSALSICIVLACFCCCDFYVFVVCEFGVESQS